MSGKETTLIVDDNIDACRLLGVLLDQLGENAICKESGRQALEYLQNHIPRLILLAAIMRGMSGMEVLQAIRRDQRLAAVPVIVMSGGVDNPASAQEAKQQGATEYWVKSEVLYKNLKQLLAPYLTRTSVMSFKVSGSTKGKIDDSRKRAN
jgi:CheY-like chemotaxis protein